MYIKFITPGATHSYPYLSFPVSKSDIVHLAREYWKVTDVILDMDNSEIIVYLERVNLEVSK